MPALALLAGLGGALLARGLGALAGGFGVANSLFGSFVSVTGDAHQAQVAQDIFRADILHELSLLIREDMRDVYALMCEAVNTQVTMGSIVLGACFTVFIEGYAESGPTWIIELWAMMVSWAVMFTFSSLLLAMYFQTSIGTRVRERLLVKHRIFTPNDTVISSLGGYSLAEQVGRLHARLVNQLAAVASRVAAGGPDAASAPSPQPSAEESASARLRAAMAAVAEERQEELQPKVTLLGPQPLGALVRARLGVQAWFEEEGPEEADAAPAPAGAGVGADVAEAGAARGRPLRPLSPRKIMELPNFLVGGTLVRQPWVSECGEPLRLLVHDEATLYLAGRPLPVEGREESSPTPKSRPSLSQALELDRVRRAWDEMPAPIRGNHHDNGAFQRVEGFSVYVDSHKIHLPLYKLALRAPEGGSPVEVEVAWGFQAAVEALIIVVREGCVLGSEDEFPKQAFMQEIEVLRPHLLFSSRFMQCGTSCLLLGVAFLHLSRILAVRPWPACLGETLAVASAVLAALAGTWLSAPVARAEALGEASSAQRRTGQTLGQTCGGTAGPVTGRGSRLVSSKLYHQRNRNWRTLAGCSAVLAAFFVTSLASCVLGALLDGVGQPAPADAAPAAAQWAAWPLEWPKLLLPTAAALSADGLRLWVASGWLLVALDAEMGGLLRPRGAPRRLANGTAGLSLIGDELLLATEEGFLHPLAADAGAGAPFAGALALVAAPAAAAEGAPVAVPGELGAPLAAMAAAPALGGEGMLLAFASATPGSGVLLCQASGLRGPDARIEALARMRLPDSTEVRALFLCTQGSCAERGARIWAADGDGRLIQASLDSGEFASVTRPFAAGLRVAALAGNETHLLAISDVEDPSQPPEAQIASFEALLPGGAEEL